MDEHRNEAAVQDKRTEDAFGTCSRFVIPDIVHFLDGLGFPSGNAGKGENARGTESSST